MIPKIVLTGGACGGKTTAIDYLRKRLPDFGYSPFFVPECATQMFKANFRWKDVCDDEEKSLLFQSMMVRRQIDNEDWYEKFAKIMPGKKKVLVCDRGAMDNMAYVPDEYQERVFNTLAGFDYFVDDLKMRYIGVIHLTSLAFLDSFEKNNPARYETPDEAKYMCDRTFDTWKRGERLYHVRIPASVSLEVKMEQVAKHVVSILEANGF